jgi:hypothetical protein
VLASNLSYCQNRKDKLKGVAVVKTSEISIILEGNN